MKENGDSEDLEVVAIQADSIPEARVFTPSDGKGWFFAKSLVQRADFNVLQVCISNVLPSGVARKARQRNSKFQPQIINWNP